MAITAPHPLLTWTEIIHDYLCRSNESKALARIEDTWKRLKAGQIESNPPELYLGFLNVAVAANRLYGNASNEQKYLDELRTVATKEELDMCERHIEVLIDEYSWKFPAWYGYFSYLWNKLTRPFHKGKAGNNDAPPTP